MSDGQDLFNSFWVGWNQNNACLDWDITIQNKPTFVPPLYFRIGAGLLETSVLNSETFAPTDLTTPPRSALMLLTCSPAPQSHNGWLKH